MKQQKQTSIATQTIQRKAKVPRLSRYDAVASKLLATFDPFRIFVDISSSTKKRSNFGMLDLFSGAGGISLGFEQANYQVKCAVEIVEIAAETHLLNFPDTKMYCGDIGSFKTKDHVNIEDIQIVTGGPPCQGFSVAGKRDPNDPRNKLFEEFVRVVGETQPDYFVMENVPGILTMSNGKVKDAILEAFEEVGYPNVSVAILDAANYGAPQIRARAIFIGNRHNLPNPFPAPILSQSEYVSIESAISDLPAWDRIPELNHEWSKHSKAFTARIAKVGPGESLYETFADAYKRQYRGIPSMTVKENHGGTHIHPDLDRCISAREMARLQTFPDSFFFLGGMKKAMWQIGNAVPPLLANSIARALIPFLSAVKDKTIPKYNRVILEGEALDKPDSLFD